MAMPEVSVEIAFDSGYNTPAASRTWTDVSDYVDADRDISISRGRAEEDGQPQPSRLSLTLDNRDGRFTPEYAAGAYYPNVKKGRPIQVLVATPGNILPANEQSNEAAGGWSDLGSPATTIAQSAVRAIHGTKSALLTWPGSGTPAVRNRAIGLLTNGVQYTWSTYVWVPTGSANVNLAVDAAGATAIPTVTTKDAWVRVSSTFTATGTTHNLQIDPSPAAGTGTVYLDASQLQTGPDATPFTTSAPGLTPRFTGYIDEWPVEWPGGSSSMSTVTVTAQSRLARTARTATFKSIVEEEVLADVPVLYFPLGEPAGALEAGNIAPARSERLVVTQVGTGGTLEFGAGTGPGTDDLTAPVFTPVDASNGLCLKANLLGGIVPAGALVMALEASFTTTDGTGGTIASITDGLGTLDTGGLTIWVNSSGNLQAGYIRGGGSPNAAPISVASVVDGAIHHAVVKVTLNDSTDTCIITASLDGASIGSSSSVAWPYVTPGGTAFFPEPVRMFAGGHPSGTAGTNTEGLFTGTVSHVALFVGPTTVADARFQAHYGAGSTGFSGEASGARIARYARLSGIPAAEISTETGLSTSIAHKDTTGETPVGLMQDVATTEDGLVFDGKDGTLTFHARSHRYGSTSAFTLDAVAGDIEQGLMPKLDDRNLSNDVSASRPNGATVRSANDASIAEYGYYRESLELLTTSDNEVQSRADWQVYRFGTPRVTIPNVASDVGSASSGLVTSLLAADIGTRFTMTNLPSQAPATTMDFFIEGITETIRDDSYRIEFNVSAAAYANVWIWDSATESQWDQTTTFAY